MEFSVSGNALKTFARSITCLARIGNELAIQASPSQGQAWNEKISLIFTNFADDTPSVERSEYLLCRLGCQGSRIQYIEVLIFHSLNSSRSAYLSITLKPSFFDVYTVSGTQVQCSVLLKAICSVLRTPTASVDHLSVLLTDPDASKVQWTLDCNNGMRKAYWITCNVEPDIQHLSLDRRRLPSSFVVRPRDLSRLLANFQSTLQEITIIATSPTSLPSDAASEIGGKAVELRSYIDPSKDNDSSLHTQLWIDPTEEFVHYHHNDDPVDVTFGVKELKAFLSFCEGCEIDIHLYFEKAGEPILMAPKFGVDDGSSSNFDATLVLATMLVSQLHDRTSAGPPPAEATTHDQSDQGAGSKGQERARGNVSQHPSDHTRIWSELSASAARSGSGAQGERNPNANEQRERISALNISATGLGGGNVPSGPNTSHAVETDRAEEPQDRAETNDHGFSQRHASNWVDADEDDDEGDEPDLCVQATPPYFDER